jgi:non-lysosomal glucosylceramidase
LRWIGNYYATTYKDAWQSATHVANRLGDLEQKTARFVSSVCESDLPDEAKEAALFNLSTLRTQTCFRTPEGYLFGWEDCQDRIGSCFGSCTHVWNYEQAVAFLFGDLANGMREVEFSHATDARGLMSFRVNLPLENGAKFGVAAADGQMGCLIKTYREWQLSGDDAFLRRLWPQFRKALEFCWIPGGWDADQDGVMEGCQHNTMDVEYYGPNPQMGFLYLCALRCAEQLAEHLGEKDLSETCHRLFRNGSSWLDENLFNGEYYDHHVIAPKDDFVAKGLAWNMGTTDLESHLFWSTGYAWGTLAQTPGETETQAELTVRGGRLKIRRFVLAGRGSAEESDFKEI